MVCGQCNRAASRLYRLRQKHAQVCENWTALPESDWQEFATLAATLGVEALKDRMRLDVKQYKERIDEQTDQQKRLQSKDRNDSKSALASQISFLIMLGNFRDLRQFSRISRNSDKILDNC